MPFENLNSNHFSSDEKAKIEANIAAIEAVITPKLKNLNADDRQKYGSVNESNKLIINKVNDYKINQPNLRSPDVDWAEFQRDYDSRAFLQATILRLQGMIEGLNNNKILHDFDNYQASLTDYNYTKYKAETKVAGFESKTTELAQFFSRSIATANAAKNNNDSATS